MSPQVENMDKDKEDGTTEVTMVTNGGDEVDIVISEGEAAAQAPGGVKVDKPIEITTTCCSSQNPEVKINDVDKDEYLGSSDSEADPEGTQGQSLLASKTKKNSTASVEHLQTADRSDGDSLGPDKKCATGEKKGRGITLFGRSLSKKNSSKGSTVNAQKTQGEEEDQSKNS